VEIDDEEDDEEERRGFRLEALVVGGVSR